MMGGLGVLGGQATPQGREGKRPKRVEGMLKNYGLVISRRVLSLGGTTFCSRRKRCKKLEQIGTSKPRDDEFRITAASASQCLRSRPRSPVQDQSALFPSSSSPCAFHCESLSDPTNLRLLQFLIDKDLSACLSIRSCPHYPVQQDQPSLVTESSMSYPLPLHREVHGNQLFPAVHHLNCPQRG